jgi:hypothetical protein
VLNRVFTIAEGGLLFIQQDATGRTANEPNWCVKHPQLSNLLILGIVAEAIMKRFIEGEARTQVILLPK